MLAVWKHTVKRAYGRLSVILALSLWVLCGGLLASLFHLRGATSDISYTLRALLLPTVLLLPIPALAVFSPHAEDVWLLSRRLRPWEILLGRFGAAGTLLALPMGIFALYPLALSFFGTVNFPSAYLSLLSYLLCLLFLLALLDAFLSLIRHAVVRVILSFAIPLALYLWDPLCGLLPDTAYHVLTAYSPFAMFRACTYGEIYLQGVLYFVSLTALLLAVASIRLGTIQGMWKQPAGKRLCAIVLAVCLLVTIGLNLGAVLLPSQLRLIDVTGEESFTVSGTSKDAVRAIGSEVTLYYLVYGGASNAANDLWRFLQTYGELNDRVTVLIKDTKAEPQFVSRYTADELPDHSILAVGAERSYCISANSLYHYYNADLDLSFSSTEYTYCLNAYQYYTSTGSAGSYESLAVQYGEYLTLSATTTAYFDGDYLVTNALCYVTGDTVPTVYAWSGTGASLDSTLRSYLSARGYFFKDLLSLRTIPADCDLLLLYSPTADLSDTEADSLALYLENGGKCLLATSKDYPELLNLYRVTEAYGLSASTRAHTVCQTVSAAEGEEETYAQSFYASLSSHKASGSFAGRLALITPHAITLKQTDGVTVTSWITSSTAKLLYADTEEYAGEDSYTCGAIAESGETRLIWISSALALGYQGYAASATSASDGNYELIKTALDWAVENRYTTLSISSTALPSSLLNLTDGQASIGTLILTVACPLALALPLLWRWQIRRRR